MMRMGIVGAENSHTAAIAKLLNVQRAIKGFRVTHMWGETPELAAKAAQDGKIATIVADPREMIGQIDCVMIDHRDGQYHLPAARAFLQARVPMFIDKPLCRSVPQGRAFLAQCARRKVPVTSFSAVPLQESAKRAAQGLAAIGPLVSVHLDGPGGHTGPHGGIWFYGIHLADLMVELLGPGVHQVGACANGDHCSAVCNYPNGLTVTMSFFAQPYQYSVSAVGMNGTFAARIDFDANLYLTSAKIFTRMFRTGEMPFDAARMLAPLAMLDAFERSLATGKAAKVEVVGRRS